ncbi:MAG TPA: response regulator, partial [Nitrososphaera sp.]|nr:response regulator [Nitrososphaera sp.]
TMAEALLLAEARSYDLYLLDNLLPDGTGIELCQRIREFDATTPIIFATGSASDEEKQQAMSVGAQAYLFKPIDLDLLERAITHLDTEPREESKFFMD